MKYAADFRREAREALRGKWVLAILAGVVAMLLGGTLSNGPQVNFSYSGGDLSANLQYAGQNIYAWGNGITPGLRAFFVGSAIYLVLAALVLAVLYFILGSVICVGYARFNLDLTGGEKPHFTGICAAAPCRSSISDRFQSAVPKGHRDWREARPSMVHQDRKSVV